MGLQGMGLQGIGLLQRQSGMVVCRSCVGALSVTNRLQEFSIPTLYSPTAPTPQHGAKPLGSKGLMLTGFTDQQCCCSDAGADAHTIAENSVGRHTCRSMVTILLRIILLIVRHYSHHTLQWVSTCHTKCIAVDFKVVQKVPVM